MSAQVAPTVPPRPTRAQQAAAHGANKLPEVPPRPLNKRLERSVSPGHYPRSPLNEPWNGNLARQKTNEQTEAMPRRPSVQHLPSLGQEGMEYGEIMEQANQQPPSASAPPTESVTQTRNIAQDLKLHAPKPSLPKSSAAAQIQAVTRTDSQQAAQHGIGKPSTPSQDEGDSLGRVRTRTSFSRPNSTVGNERRSSIHGDESGPAELGLRVPINPLLGDVQAPTPGMTPSHTGDSAAYRKLHSRSKSRDVSAPPGSYGLHGHGVIPQDKFEKDWYAKHPEAAQHEETTGHGVYESIGSGRGSFALSSDDLNKIVRETAIRGSGLGTSSTTYSYPDEQIGYAASEVFISRSQMNTPNNLNLTKTATNASQPVVESPLRKASFPADETIPAEVRRGRLSTSGRSEDHEAVESEAEQEVQIQPRRRVSKITGGEETLDETLEAEPYVSHPTGEGNYVNEHGYTVPILAADEVAKEVGIEHLQPAVSPRAERRGSEFDLDFRSGEATPGSRPSSRPSSLYGLQNTSQTGSRSATHHEERESMHTPLEDVEEYEPLFPEDEEDKKKPLSHAERFKQRPNSLRQRFPSQDIWEDTPSSALHLATVSTPDLPTQTEEPASKVFEPPEKEAARKQEPSEEERKKLIPNEERLAKSKFAPHLRDDMPTRPGQAPRFPSSDIWEDSPESHQLVAVVSTPPVDDEEEDSGEVEVPIKPSVPPRPAGKNRLGEGASSAQVAPSVPPRPQQAVNDSKGASTSPTELKKVPSIPDRPKPQIPVRPAKKLGADALSKTQSRDSTGSAEHDKVSPPLSKAKPQVPARPGLGSKIANLRGNFMNDLNQKLGMGPPEKKEPKEPEPVLEETKPLDDARKGRARGPQRRAPAKTSGAAASPPQFSIFKPRALWTIDDNDEVNIADVEPAVQEDTTKAKDASNVAASNEQAEQPDTSTSGDIGTSSTTETHDHAEDTENRKGDEPVPHATPLARNTAGELAEPALESASEQKPDQSSKNPADEDVAGLSQHTTASTAEASGPELEKETPNPNTDAIPASRQTTAGTDADTVPLERSPPQEPRAVKPAEGEPGKASAEEV
ncbi:hypothetical protein HRR83_000923 [Exophiala dermatitidis]|uniref:Altered inheritance of mitochondria protein 21 n=1 Tax=Exophiala dermatitidis TaxID=5970 RepID=A0AAN6IZA2_EXODE|nr:hypothetical protein HRR75_000838 [Exophiala dermatitidis]KAJ4528172.1 hypothetical protein HRR74_000927 [Exophiala dermatitidis]KAJ4528805.1 hypothetical protein HRR73_001428 [Exophiala dermatitidis]KAJ4530190.1 hypothetical protein HRR76_009424 [Exophiala dermatitidis]KAJ4553134.1 hypothetical protein HRR78_003393 [Exophiala dermatitidis]